MHTSSHEFTQDVHLTYCPVCGLEAEELTIGTVLKYYTAEDGELIGYGHPGGVLALSLIESGVEYKTKPLEDYERAPAGDPCADCVADIAHQRAEFKVEIEKGGIHWYCEDCGVWGVIAHDDSYGFSATLRRRTGVAPPNHMGVRFKNCRQHESEEDPDGTLH